MNYMQEVAKMLGVEFGERFRLYDNEREYDVNYYFLEDGIYTDINSKPYRANSGLLLDIVTGEYCIKRKPWKPNIEDLYYIVDELGQSCSEQWYEDSIDINYYKIGNCYKTRKEAEENSEKWKAFYTSDEVLEI